jgi:hypothetical protein
MYGECKSQLRYQKTSTDDLASRPVSSFHRIPVSWSPDQSPETTMDKDGNVIVAANFGRSCLRNVGFLTFIEFLVECLGEKRW